MINRPANDHDFWIGDSLSSSRGQSFLLSVLFETIMTLAYGDLDSSLDDSVVDVAPLSGFVTSHVRWPTDRQPDNGDRGRRFGSDRSDGVG